MSVRNNHTVRPRQHGKVTEARRAYLAQHMDWEHRRHVWHQYLGRQPRGAGLGDSEGTTWSLLMPDEAGDVFTYRVWQADNGMALLEPDLAGVLAWQDVHASRHGALGRAIRSAGSALRWTALGLWRTPAVRVAGLMLGAAIVAALVVVAGWSVNP